ncbi:hypothetical protein MPSEU_000858400 [Mayamaea pseudoterrestris]|nr:hypothetical protein MPSEU_000858400 [Mayamaea pseudoterrestris]
MKRALAERVKQQSLSSPSQQDSTLPPAKLRRVATAPVSSSSSSDFLTSIADHVSEPPLTVSSDAVLTSPADTVMATAASNSPKATASFASVPADNTNNSRKRPELSVPDDANAFYLRHQNRALAVEWRDLNDQVQSLRAERDDRRRHCAGAVQAIQSLHVSWVQLEEELVKSVASSSNGESNSSQHIIASSAPQDGNSAVDSSAAIVPMTASTGSGESVEWTVALSQALSELGQSLPLKNGLDNCTSDSSSSIHDLEWSHQCASNISARAAILQNRLASVLLKRPEQSGLPEECSPCQHQPQIHELQSQVANLRAELAESVASRSDAVANERKLRRNFYKLQAGLLTKEQFMNELNMDQDEDLGAWADQQDLLADQVRRNQHDENLNGSHNHDELNDSMRGETSSATSAQVQALHGQVQDLEQKVANRDESIQRLSHQLMEKEKRINQLAAKQQPDDDRRKLEVLQGAAHQLEAAQATMGSLEVELQDVREKWAVALGNEQTIQQAMEEQQQKFAKKWEELSATFRDGDQQQQLDESSHSSQQQIPAENNGDVPAALLRAHSELQAQEIIHLRHRLTQAIENVRQAESSREDLINALALNESLHTKVDDLKSKLAAASENNGNNIAAESNSANLEESLPLNMDGGSNASIAGNKDGGVTASTGVPSAEKFEKLHREHRRMRKDMSAILASKEAAKSKLERAEKERDSLLEMNARLLKQMNEKDEMNAKSLSTILHLKGMTEQLVAERDSLEQQAKSASQLALAARLAANAKERVSEEVVQEKLALDKQLHSLKEMLAASKRDLDRLMREESVAREKLANLNAELANAIMRSDELVDAVEKKNAEIRDLVDLVKKAERKASDNADKQVHVSDSNGGPADSSTSNFSVQQLNTQIGVLKSKLACPVCHYRDKECIILRCRHLHCKHCVEERITSRNRKCPTCNNKFTEKDVADIWLNT